MIDNTQLVSMVNETIENAESKETESKGRMFTTRFPEAEKVEAIMATLMEYPPLAQDDLADVSRAFNEKGWPTFDAATLDSLRPSIVPIVVMRHLLATQRCTFDPTKVPTWDAFSDRYQQAILDA